MTLAQRLRARQSLFTFDTTPFAISTFGEVATMILSGFQVMHLRRLAPSLLLILLFIMPSSGRAQWQRGIVLKGTICTMNSAGDVIKNGAVLIKQNKIEALLRQGDPVPSTFDSAVTITSDGYIYPGLMDIHNHPAYNVLPLWTLPHKYKSWKQWSDDASYKSTISRRYRRLFDTLKCRELMGVYAEVKAMAGGTTVLQGLPVDNAYYTHMVRNPEGTNFGSHRIGGSVIRLSKTSPNLADVRMVLKSDRDAWFYHLAEGSDSSLREELYDLQDFKLNLTPIVGIHSAALLRADFHVMDSAGMSMVWSPLSNLILYGSTADVRAARAEGVLISLGSDWSPSGSKSILWELKVAYLLNESQLNNLFTPRELVQMVTVNPARALKWNDKVGSLKQGMYADLIVTEKQDEDPYMNLIKCTEDDIELVLVDGEPYYGDSDIMQDLKGKAKGKALKTVTDKLDHHKVVDCVRTGFQSIPFDSILSRLKSAMSGDHSAGAPHAPDPMFTELDPGFFAQLLAIVPPSLSVERLASFVYPVGKTEIEAPLLTAPSGHLLTTLPKDRAVIVVKTASGRRRNWHEVFAVGSDGKVYRGVVRKTQISLKSPSH